MVRTLSNNELLSLKNINKSFRKTEVLKNLSLNIYSNEIVALLGKSGCGKSTLFKILLGFYNPDSGNIFYDSKKYKFPFKKIRNVVGFVSQENSFYEELTVRENLVFFSKLYGVPRKDVDFRLDFLLKLVNLENFSNLISKKLSGGMKRRLEFAISLIHNPKILILDEPFTGLDVKIRDELWEVLKHIRNNGVTVLIASHLISSVQKNVDRVVFLHKKKIVEELVISKTLKNPRLYDLEAKFKEVVLNWFLELLWRIWKLFLGILLLFFC